MEIVAFEPGMAAGVARCYNELVAPAPHCGPIGEGWFRDPARLARQPCSQEEILVARERGGEIAGFVHLGVAAPATEDWHVKGEPGVIRFLAYRPGQRAVGAALLEAAESWLREKARSEIIAGHWDYLYPSYHLPYGHLSERICHLPPLFGMAGYRVEESEVFFEWPDFEAPSVARPPIEFEVSSDWHEESPMGPGVTVRAMQVGCEMGHSTMNWLGYGSWRPELQQWCFCDHLFVEEPFRGQGLGKYLLAQSLQEMRNVGCRHAIISTDHDNHRAALCYTNVGYRFLDRTFSFRKELKAK